MLDAGTLDTVGKFGVLAGWFGSAPVYGFGAEGQSPRTAPGIGGPWPVS